MIYKALFVQDEKAENIVFFYWFLGATGSFGNKDPGISEMGSRVGLQVTAERSAR